jgi:hypothetical protein
MIMREYEGCDVDINAIHMVVAFNFENMERKKRRKIGREG